MSTDITLGDTIYRKFTSRAFATGIPTTLAGTPVISIYENDSLTQITAGITLTVDFDGVTGLNHLTIVATGGNGFESGKDYQCVVTTGTVGGVSVVGEVVKEFTIERSAAAVDLANGTDGLGAIKTDTAATLVDTAEIGVAGAGLTNINLPNQTMDITGNLSGSVGSVTGSVGSVVGHTPQTGDNFARLGAPAGASVSADVAAVKVDTAAILVDTAEIGTAGAGLTDLGGMSTGMQAEVNAEMVDVMSVDTVAMPGQVAPPLAPTRDQMASHLYKNYRNRKEQTATQWSLMADDETTVDQKATVSDDGTTAIKQEIVTGP